jgi:hypothetical protein
MPTDIERLLARSAPATVPEGWETVRTLILSDQIPADRVAEIHRDHPDFAVWMTAPNKADCTARRAARIGNLCPQPSSYDLADPKELDRLFREAEGYIATCERRHHGTDRDGRLFARAALADLRTNYILTARKEGGA